MSKSKRHHYIPKFFIKNFTDNDGFLYVYNKEKNNILKNKQSPKGIFFENDRNTVNFSGHQLDNLESLYSALDSSIAKDYLNVIQNETVTPEELVSITLLANLLKWRVPKSDEKFNILKNDLSQEDLKIKISLKNKNTKVDKKALEHLESSDIFKEAKRIILSVLPLQNENKLLEIHNNSFLQMNPMFPSLLGDNPIIMEGEASIHQINNFVFPLSSDTTFIYKKGSNREVTSGLFFFQRDLTILHNSTKYIGCKSRDHLEKVIEMYHKIKTDNNLEYLDKYIFKFVK